MTIHVFWNFPSAANTGIIFYLGGKVSATFRRMTFKSGCLEWACCVLQAWNGTLSRMFFARTTIRRVCRMRSLQDHASFSVLSFLRRYVLSGLIVSTAWRTQLCHRRYTPPGRTPNSAYRSLYFAAPHSIQTWYRMANFLNRCGRPLLTLSYTSMTPIVASVAEQQRISALYLLFFDGGSRGNPGPGGAGSVIVKSHVPTHAVCIMQVASVSYSSTHTTNNVAEYLGLVNCLSQAKASGYSTLHTVGDSALVLSQLRTHHPPHKPHLKLPCWETRAFSRRY